MVRDLIKKLIGKALGRDKKAAAKPPARAATPRPAVRPMEDDDDGGGHNHGHSHSHDHGHSHDHAPPPPEPEHDHGHDHGHSHDHGHGGREAIEVSFEDTPNPNAMKFTLSVKIGPKALNLTSANDDHPLARRVFKIPGVRSVFAVNNFVTVTKDDSAAWGGLTHPIVEALQEVFGAA